MAPKSILLSFAAFVTGVVATCLGQHVVTNPTSFVLPDEAVLSPITIGTPHHGLEAVFQVFENRRQEAVLSVVIHNKIGEMTKDLRVPAGATLNLNGQTFLLPSSPTGVLATSIPLRDVLFSPSSGVGLTELGDLLERGISLVGSLEVSDSSGHVVWSVSVPSAHVAKA